MPETSFALTAAELALFENLPEDQLVELAAELELLVPAEISRAALLVDAVDQIVARARAEGLPFSKYDHDDLAALSTEDLAALGALCKAPGTPDGLIRAGQRVYKQYLRQRPQSQVAMMLPMLLSAVARRARHGES